MNPRIEFLKARDFLLLHRTDYDYAYGHFRWPKMEEFNWALEYFDEIAEGNQNTALWIVDEQGHEEKYTFAELSARSNQVANYLRKLHISPGDPILLILGNESAHWEIVLAAMKLGATIIPVSSLLSEEEIQERLNRTMAKMVITSKKHLDKFRTLAPQTEKILVDGSNTAKVEGWHNYSEATKESAEFEAPKKPFVKDTLFLFFAPQEGAPPKIVEHTYQSFPVGHLSTMYWMGLRPGDVHLNLSSPGWAKHTWASFFAPWNAESCVFVYKSEKLDAKALLAVLQKYPITSLSAPPAVWKRLAREKLEDYETHLSEAISAGDDFSQEVMDRFAEVWNLQIRQGYGQTETTALVGQSPGIPIKVGSLGRPLPGYEIFLVDRQGNINEREGELSLRLTHPPVGLMAGYRGNQLQSMEAMSGSFYGTGDIVTRDEEGHLTYVGRTQEVFRGEHGFWEGDELADSEAWAQDLP